MSADSRVSSAARPPAGLAVGVLGASGYGGGELIRRLLRHPGVRLEAVASRQYLGQPLQACWPQLLDGPELTFTDADGVIEASEVVFCATPHGATAPLVARALDAGRRVIDLSADFRLPPEEFQQWYGLEHPHPELYPLARYGLVELHRQELLDCRLVAVPGCNASTAILALAPLATAGLLGEVVIADIKTGVSGAGRGVGLGTHFAEVNENVKPYKVAGTHRHTAEIEGTLGRAAHGRWLQTQQAPAERPKVAFTPHLVPMTRGILASCYARPAALPSGDELLALYRDFYRHDPLVQVTDDLPQTKVVSGSDRTVVSVRADQRSGMIAAFAVIDNLGKGAAGQAVQAFNVAFGFEETTALEREGRWP